MHVLGVASADTHMCNKPNYGCRPQEDTPSLCLCAWAHLWNCTNQCQHLCCVAAAHSQVMSTQDWPTVSLYLCTFLVVTGLEKRFTSTLGLAWSFAVAAQICSSDRKHTCEVCCCLAQVSCTQTTYLSFPFPVTVCVTWQIQASDAFALSFIDRLDGGVHQTGC